MNHEGDIFFNPITLCFYQRRATGWGAGCRYYSDAKTVVSDIDEPPRYLSGALVCVGKEDNRFSVKGRFGWTSSRHPDTVLETLTYPGPLFLGGYWGLSDALTSKYSEQPPKYIMFGA
jgi:hypothetical protein